MRAILDGVHRPLVVPEEGLWVVLVVGVNGSGKTTDDRQARRAPQGEGRKVLLAAGDTFRAAAEQQLGIWAERAGVDIVALDEGADPGAVAFKALERARAGGPRRGDRRHRRAAADEEAADGAAREDPARARQGAAGGAARDAARAGRHDRARTASSQARLFHEATPLTGAVVTKLDGTAKGGMILAIATELQLPVKLVGLGEKVGDLRDFEPGPFVDALVGVRGIWNGDEGPDRAFGGRKYALRSDEDEDPPAIARYVDRKMAEIGGRGSRIDEYTLALLTALNIASEFDRFRREVDGELASLDRDLASTAVLLEAALPEDAGEEVEAIEP